MVQYTQFFSINFTPSNKTLIMKQFFKMMLASMVGFILAGVLLILFLTFYVVAIIGSVSTSNKQTVAEKPNAVLNLDLSYIIPERSPNNTFDGIDWSALGGNKVIGLNDILADIHKAKTDDNIKGIFLNFDVFPSGISTAKAIRDALLDFKKSGKFIDAYAVAYTQKAYYISSVADKVFLNPMGVVEFPGLGVQIMFFKDLLDKLGIETQVFYDGKYKTATEPFRRDNMSDANKVMTMSMIDDLQKSLYSAIAASRHISYDSLITISDNLLIRDAKTARQYKFVDNLGYYDQFLDELRSRLHIGKRDKVELVSLDKYNEVPSKNFTISDDKIAVVYAQGDIVDGKGENGEIGGDHFAQTFRELRDDNNVKAVVLRVNSPGGSGVASDVIWREVGLLKEKKPVIVSMGDYAASGGYYISCNATKIVAEPTTLTGSIGVFGILPNLKKFWNDKLSITFDGVGTGKFSDFGDINRPLTDDEKQIIQNAIDTFYHTFKSRVAAGRHLNIDTVQSLAQGRVWMGDQAVKLGLVDTLGSIGTAIKMAAKAARISTYELESYPKEKSKLAELFKMFDDDDDNSNAAAIKNMLGSASIYLEELKSLQNMKGVQARLPEVIEVH
jgi:protease IV